MVTVEKAAVEKVADDVSGVIVGHFVRAAFVVVMAQVVEVSVLWL